MQAKYIKAVKISAGAVAVFTGLAAVSSSAALYPDLAYSGPVPAPELPANFSAFAPPVTNQEPSAGTPVIAEWTRQNDPGDTLIITGDNLSSFSGASEGSDTRFVLFGQDFSPSDGFVHLIDGSQAALTLPDKELLGPNQMYFLWPYNNAGYGRPVAVNKTEAWWVGPSRIEKGKEFSVYGRNLMLGDGSCYLYIKELDRWIQSVSANPYKADFIMPFDVPTGSYTLYAHNTHGGQYGWSGAVKAAVVAPLNYNGSILNVESFGADGSDSADDYPAIDAAFKAAKRGDRIYFPAGIYRVSTTLYSLPSGVEIYGAGMDATILTSLAGFTGPDSTQASIINESLSSDVTFRDMTLASGRYAASGSQVYRLKGATNLRFLNVKFDQSEKVDADTYNDDNGGNPILGIFESDGVLVSNCVFILDDDVDAHSINGFQLVDSDFYGIHDCNQMVTINDAHNVSIEGCTAQPLGLPEENKVAKGRFIVANGNTRATYNIYYGNNVTTNMVVRENGGTDQNAGEQFLFENGATFYRGRPDASAARSLHFSDLSADYTDYLVVIISGKGMGQVRTITSCINGTVVVSEDWKVQPDASSIAMIGQYFSRVAVYNNYFHGGIRAVTNRTDVGCAGVEPYGGTSHMIIDGNTFDSLRSAVEIWSVCEDLNGTSTMQPEYFNVVKNNTIKNCRYGIETRGYGFSEGSYHPDTGLLGNVYRANTIYNMKSWATSFTSWQTNCTKEITVYDSNTFRGMPIVANYYDEDYWRTKESPVRNQVWTDNIAEQCDVGIVAIEGSTFVLSGNDWNNTAHTGIATVEMPPPPDDPPAPVLIGIQISGPLAVDEESAGRYVCTASYSDGTTGVVDPQWSEDSSYASIDGFGILTTGSVDQDRSITITAVHGGLTATYGVVISYVPPVLESIVISGPAALDEGTTAQYNCEANYSDGTTLAIIPSWSVDHSAAVISSGGLLSADDVTADTEVTVTASFNGISDTYNVTVRYVPPVLTGLTIVGPGSVDEEKSAQFNCIGTYSDGSTEVVAPLWNDNSSVVSISASGLLSAGNVDSDQMVEISAAFGGLSAAKSVLIKYVAPHITGIEISGPAEVKEEETGEYRCEAVYSDGSRQVVNPQWSVSGNASINTAGQLTADDVTADQNATVTASFEGQTDSLSVVVRYVPPTLIGISISGPAYVDEQTSAGYTCTALYSDETTKPVVPEWSDDSPYASISSSGVLTAGDVAVDESVIISATFEGVTESYSVTIGYVAPPVVVTELSISAPAVVEELSVTNLACTVYWSDGSSAVVDPVWTVDASFASVDGSGRLSIGNIDMDSSVAVTASFGGKSASRTIEIWAVGTQIIYPLNGFEGKTVKARLFDDVSREWHELGEMSSPRELVIEHVNPDQWYWLSVQEYDEGTAEWIKVHSTWISM